MNKLNNTLTKETPEVMNMQQLKMKMLTHLSNVISKQTPQQVATYANQFKGTNEDYGEAVKDGSIEDSVNTGITGQMNSSSNQGTPYIPKKVKSGFMAKKS